MKLQLGINHVTNAEYHADTEFLSSSKLKLLLTDLPKFHKEIILGDKAPQEQKNAFDEGSYVHSLILEPHKIASEYVFFSGFRKQGKEWESFQANAPADKRILSKPQKHRCEQWASSIKQRLLQVLFLTKGAAEHTICAILQDVKVKVRCDRINIEEGWIADIKTTGSPADLELFKYTMKDYFYQLSAALYCMVAELVYAKKFNFYFIVVSKTDNVCDVYKLSEKTRLEGIVQVTKALNIYKQCLNTGIWTVNAPKQPELSSQYEIFEV